MSDVTFRRRDLMDGLEAVANGSPVDLAPRVAKGEAVLDRGELP